MPSDPRESVCSACGKAAEVKPFGKDGALICYDCWMADDSPNYSFTIHKDGRISRRSDPKVSHG